MMPFFCVHISQGSVATCLKRGGIFKHEFVANLLLSRLVKKKLKIRIIVSEVIAKSLVSCFLTHGVVSAVSPVMTIINQHDVSWRCKNTHKLHLTSRYFITSKWSIMAVATPVVQAVGASEFELSLTISPLHTPTFQTGTV